MKLVSQVEDELVEDALANAHEPDASPALTEAPAPRFDRKGFDFTATIRLDGTITMMIDNPEDSERGRPHLMKLAAALAGDNPIAYSECIGTEDVEAIARRLARMILGEVA